MANETQYSDFKTVAAAVDAGIVPMFTSRAIMPRLVASHNLVGAANTRSRDLPKSGAVVASVIAELNAATSQTLTDTKVTLTLQKAIVYLRLSIESLKFAAAANPNRLTRLSAQACAKKFDQDACGTFGGFSQSEDAGTVMTVAAVMRGAYKVRAGDIPSDSLATVLHYQQAQQVGEDIRTSSGAFYSNSNFNPERVVDGGQKIPGYLGHFFGVDWYETGNTTATGGNHQGAVFCPEYAIAALYPAGDAPAFETEFANQTEFANSITGFKTTMWYQVAENVDAAGVLLASDQS